MDTKSIDQILQGKIPFVIQLKNFGVRCKKHYLLRRYGSFQGLCNKEGFSDYNIDASSFDGTKKKQGISGIARLRNAEEFLELAIESHLPYFDEIILADNVSKDNTWTICQELAKKYPHKIKAIQYPFITHKLGSEEYKNSTSDSVYDLSYFYNRVLSHVSYRRVAKVDDDHLMIPEVMKNNRKIVMSDTHNATYYHMLGINVVKDKQKYRIPLKGPFMGLYGDHGFFPISRQTYYVHDDWSENFLHPYANKRLDISFIHLKYLGNYQKNYIGKYNTSNIIIALGESIPLGKKYSEVLEKTLF